MVECFFTNLVIVDSNLIAITVDSFKSLFIFGIFSLMHWTVNICDKNKFQTELMRIKDVTELHGMVFLKE